MKNNGLGYIEPKDYDKIADVVMQYLANPGDQRPDVTKLMTNQFAGLKLAAEDWSQAQKNAAEFRTYVS